MKAMKRPFSYNIGWGISKVEEPAIWVLGNPAAFIRGSQPEASSAFPNLVWESMSQHCLVHSPSTPVWLPLAPMIHGKLSLTAISKEFPDWPFWTNVILQYELKAATSRSPCNAQSQNHPASPGWKCWEELFSSSGLKKLKATPITWLSQIKWLLHFNKAKQVISNSSKHFLEVNLSHST